MLCSEHHYQIFHLKVFSYKSRNLCGVRSQAEFGHEAGDDGTFWMYPPSHLSSLSLFLSPTSPLSLSHRTRIRRELFLAAHVPSPGSLQSGSARNPWRTPLPLLREKRPRRTWFRAEPLTDAAPTSDVGEIKIARFRMRFHHAGSAVCV